MATETITWRFDLPDADSTVLVTLEDDTEPTWFGFFDGEQWLSASTGGTFPGRVVAWAEMPKGAVA